MPNPGAPPSACNETKDLRTMACSTNCPTPGIHSTFGECLRAKSLQIADPAAHKFHQHRNSELNNYVDARKAGLQPETIFKKDVDKAWRITERTGTPYRADQRG